MGVNRKVWAERAVGTKFKYQLMQVSLVVSGISLLAIFYLLTPQLELILRMVIGALIFASTIQLPLLCLASLRCFVSESKLGPIKQ